MQKGPPRTPPQKLSSFCTIVAVGDNGVVCETPMSPSRQAVLKLFVVCTENGHNERRGDLRVCPCSRTVDTNGRTHRCASTCIGCRATPIFNARLYNRCVGFSLDVQPAFDSQTSRRSRSLDSERPLGSEKPAEDLLPHIELHIIVPSRVFT